MQLFALGLVLVLVAAPAPKVDPIKDDLERLQGTWKIVSYESDGVKLSEEQIDAKPLLIIKGDQYTWSDDSGPGSIKLDPTTKPKSVDYGITEGADKGDVEKGIYEITGDTWRDCFARDGKERPTKFEAPEGSGLRLIVYKRVKK